MTPITNFSKIEDEFMSWAETELVFELLKRRMLVQCKLYEKELKEAVDEHRDNFDIITPSTYYDHMCIWFRDTTSRGLITFVTLQTHFRTYPSNHGKASSNIAP
ncbi:serine/threonine-protein phosphatase 7 long form [Dorcoceras hygrometricum]|uniref:Serine/threonine-protein phosphatase 7 long form n=1 Tax=Dorcoceras hygrometricum TaxID=472368 RepID=A0A2Z7APX1_9LAMI|nr:serine/threonine-protein phosphatase 7 long form [Dorcoceras hygrometricum]